MPQPLLSAAQLQTRLAELNQGAAGDWQLVDGKLRKVFRFADFVRAFGFMSMAAVVAEKINHHPEWRNVYKTVEVDLTTHESGGITELDFRLAAKMETLAKSVVRGAD